MEDPTVDAFNAQQIVTEIEQRLETIEHESGLIGGLLSDLAIYLPKTTTQEG